jgi:hypothetical protein
MVGRTLDLDSLLTEDQLGVRISYHYIQWEIFRQEKIKQWEELRRYIYATDTRTTTNATLPWKNTTTIPKLCQIRDNLFANYMASLFPKRKWLVWQADREDDAKKAKREAITDYMKFVVDQDNYKKEMAKCVLDYIDYGNCFATVDWKDETQILPDGKTQVGYIGPVMRRISPLDIVFNPVGSDFTTTPKIVRTILTKGEVKEILERFSNDATRPQYEELWQYMKNIRQHASNFSTNTEKSKNDIYRVDGFTSYRVYLSSDYVELLTYYGDIYDEEKDEYLRNHVIVVADRHKVIYKGPNPSFFGHFPLYHVGWRVRQDNLWAMGPLDNLVGMQYRIDHVENLKADVFDLVTFPPLKIKGYVEDFKWGPFERIYTGDDGDVEILAPPFQVLTANSEIDTLERRMEEMAGSPKEAMGFRTPGEKTAYEVQRLENAASRIFANKITQFEEQFVERLLNAMLELAKRNMTSTSIRIFDDQLKIETFRTLTPEDITGNGRVRPLAARHFAEKAEMVQNLNSFFTSAIGADQGVKVHFSSVKLAELFENLLEMEDYEIVQPYIRLSEQADAQRLANAHQEQVGMEAQTPSGLTPDQYDQDMVGGSGLPPQGPLGPPQGI